MSEPRWTGGERREGVTITLRPVSVAKLLAVIIGVLLLLHLASQVLRFGFGYEYQMGFHDRVYLGSELNIPTWFSSSLMLLCGLVLLGIARGSAQRGSAGTGYWTALGIIFVGLSMDEAAAMHELLSPIFAGTMVSLGERFGGIFVPLGERGHRYAWVIPGSIATLVLGLVFLRFLALLPPRTRWLFVLSGAIFLSGALGVETLGGVYAAIHGPASVGFVTLMTIEETLEMAGMALFLYALLRHAAVEFGSTRLRLDTPGASRVSRAA